MPQKNNDIDSNARLLIVISVMIFATLRTLDMTITNVALPYMMVSLGASADQITWVVTSYIIGTVVITPIAGFLAVRYGRKYLLLVSASGFIITSLLCGLTNDFTFILLARLLQGAFGAALNPLAQVIMLDSYPKEQSRVAMGIYGVGVMIAPIFGPLLGAYITDMASWHWLFLLNVPIGLPALIICFFFLKETETQKVTASWLDIILIVVSIGALQTVLDRGTAEDWFESHLILILTVMTVLTSIIYFIRQLLNPSEQIIKFAIFKDRNFTICFILTIIFFAGVLGKLTVVPIMLTELFNYPIIENGKIFAPLGMASLLGVLLSSKLMKYGSGKWLCLAGALLSTISSLYMVPLNLTASTYEFLIPNIIQGLGIGLFFTPISTVAFYTLPAIMIDQASALLNFARNFGSAIGIAIISTIISNKEQLNWQQLIVHISPYNKELLAHFHQLKIHYHNLAASKLLANMVLTQASMKAHVEAFWFTTVIFGSLVPLIFFISANKQGKAP